MAGILVSEETLDAVLQVVVELALRTVDGTDAVSITLARGDQLLTAAAVAEQRPVYIPSIADEARWDLFRQAASAAGMRTAMSLPLIASSSTSGALNMYAKQPGAFDPDAQQLAMLFAKQAAILVANAQAYADAAETSANLRAALESREVIGEAKGILMERERVSADEAFNILRRISQTSNRKLRDIAAEIVGSASPPGSEDP